MIARQIQRVSQQHRDGCFIACFAMMKGISYEEAYKLVHPKKDFCGEASLPPEKAIKILDKYGLETSYQPIKKIRHIKRDALLLIRWRAQPDLMHGVIFDKKNRMFLDPWFNTPKSVRTYESQLDSVWYFKAL
jgi:hypothetical protein